MNKLMYLFNINVLIPSYHWHCHRYWTVRDTKGIFSQLLATEASLGLPQAEVCFLILHTRSGISPKSVFTVTTVFDSPHQDPYDT